MKTLLEVLKALAPLAKHLLPKRKKRPSKSRDEAERWR